MELFPDEDKQDKMDKLKMYTSDPFSAKGSQFVAYAMKVNNLDQARLGYHKIYQLNPLANHVMAAINTDNYQEFVDDGEHGAGIKILKQLTDPAALTSAVFVVCRYGGIHLGPTRFDLIKEAVKQAFHRANEDNQH